MEEVKVKTDFSLAHLTLNKKLSDVTLYVGATKETAWEFPAHQFLLSESSPVFEAMFSGEYLENENEVVITDITPRIFYKLLLFIYKGELSIPSLSDLTEVVMAADKYQMDKLKSACVDKMREIKITWENFWDLLTNFFQFCNHLIPLELKIDVLLFLDQNAATILTSDNFLFLSRETVLMIISRDTLKISELVVCKALFDWSRMQCCKMHMEACKENQRKVLKDVIYMIRLTSMGRSAIIKSAIYDLLTDAEKAAVMRELVSLPMPWNSRARYSNTAERLLQQKPLSHSIEFKSPLYLIFAKDAYLHKFKIIPNENVERFSITALNDGSLEEAKTKRYYEQTASNVYIKAFVCYRLDILVYYMNLNFERDVSSYNCWSFIDDKAVLFSIEDNHVYDLEKFMSSDYWSKVFSRNPPVHDDDVISPSTYSWGLEISATFC